jgi:hypothetical protein
LAASGHLLLATNAAGSRRTDRSRDTARPSIVDDSCAGSDHRGQ